MFSYILFTLVIILAVFQFQHWSAFILFWMISLFLPSTTSGSSLIAIQRLVFLSDKLQEFVKFFEGKYLINQLRFITCLMYMTNFFANIFLPDSELCFLSKSSNFFRSSVFVFNNLTNSVTIILHSIVLYKIHKIRHILSKTRRNSELSIIFQTIPVALTYLPYLLGIICNYFNILNGPSSIHTTICELEIFGVHRIIPATFTLANWTRIRDWLPKISANKKVDVMVIDVTT
ncbi:unnamed protein product [Caenorhabditis angaria]|uniref:Uncharacterized protein n=1 Tax=Caenorhabditis angaria TaxID=860376 RepID=A0A9P1IAM1_9PELO|nr:unnamed protein product [Caenorhabditis angaria]